MKKICSAILCGFLLGVAGISTASALTIPSGSVISNGEVVPVEESASVKQAIANGDSVVVRAGKVIISLNGEIVTVPVEELRGKSKAEAIAIIGAAAAGQIADLAEAIEAEEGVINGLGRSVDDIVAEIIENPDNGGIAGIDEATANAIGQALSDAEGDPDSFITPEEACKQHGVGC